MDRRPDGVRRVDLRAALSSEQLPLIDCDTAAWAGTKAYIKVDQHYHRLEVEAQKARAARQVAIASKRFYVPQVLDLSGCRLVSEAVDGLESLKWVLHRTSDIKTKRRLGYQVGAVLGVIHSSQMEQPATDCLLPSPFDRADVVPIHGDFGLTNVQFRRADQIIVVLDWSTPSWVGQWSTHGSSSWDIGVFLTDLYYQRPLDKLHVSHPAAVARAFLAGYRSVRPYSLSLNRRLLLKVVAAYYKAACIHRRAWLRLPSLSRLALI